MKKLLLTMLTGFTLCGCQGTLNPSDDETSSPVDSSSISTSSEEEDTGLTMLRASMNGPQPVLRNTKGEIIHLRGTNAGGYMLQENWIAPTSAKCQIVTITTLDERFGVEGRKQLLDTYEDNYWTEQDFINCQELGFNVIRLPFSYMTLYDMNFANIIDRSINDIQRAEIFTSSPITLREDAFDRMDWFVETAGKYGMYVILDLHGTFGSQNGRDHSGDNFWNDTESYNNDRLWWSGALGEAYREATIQLWRDVATHYKGNPIVAAYDTLNEPAGSTTGVVTTSFQWGFFDKMYKAIREIDPDHIVMFESCWDVQHLPHPATYGWENIMYQYHQYTWEQTDNVDKQFGEMKKKIDKIVASDYGVPSLMGEFAMFSNPESWRKTFAALNEAGISWTTWTYKVKYNSSWHKSWGLYTMAGTKDVNVQNDSFETIISKWSNLQTYAPSMTYPLVKEYAGGKTEWEPL